MELDNEFELEAEVVEMERSRSQFSGLEGRVSTVEDLHDDESEVWSAGRGFLYASFGIRTGRGDQSEGGMLSEMIEG